MHIVGDVANRVCVIVDDIVDTANTLCEAAFALKQAGAKAVLAYCTHPVLSGNAVSRIEMSALDQVVVTDTIPLREDAAASAKIRQISIASLFAETIRRINEEDSVSMLFAD
jgi:ribose-phosphate pyrophosphokinase